MRLPVIHTERIVVKLSEGHSRVGKAAAREFTEFLEKHPNWNNPEAYHLTVELVRTDEQTGLMTITISDRNVFSFAPVLLWGGMLFMLFILWYFVYR